MPDNTPARVSFPVDELDAVANRDTISLAAALKPKTPAVAAAFRENFGLTTGGGGASEGIDGGAPDSTPGDGVDGGAP